MTHDALYSELTVELEQEYSKRIAEITIVENFVEYHKGTATEDVVGVIRKSLIMVLYSHFEGYCKQVLQYYVIYINKEKILSSDAKSGLIAANMHKEFRKLLDSNHKPVNMHDLLKEDGVLQQYGRRREFLGHWGEFMTKEINIGEDFIDTESNLKSHVLKKIMFQLELNYSIVDTYQNEINKLVNIRNSFAHGDRVGYPTKKEYDNYRDAVVHLMEKLKDEIETSFLDRAYIKVSS